MNLEFILVLIVCSFLHNFFYNRRIINELLSLYAPCWFPYFKDQSSWNRSIFLLKPTVKVCTCLKLHNCNDMHSTLKVSGLFNCCDDESNIKTLKTRKTADVFYMKCRHVFSILKSYLM